MAAHSYCTASMSLQGISLPQKWGKIDWINVTLRVYEIWGSVSGLHWCGCGPGGHGAVLSRGGWCEGLLGCCGQPSAPSLTQAGAEIPLKPSFQKACGLWQVAKNIEQK